MLSFDIRKKKMFEFNWSLFSCIIYCYSLLENTYTQVNGHQKIDIYCKFWNTDKNKTYLKVDSDKKIMKIRFHPLPQYRLCFNSYEVYLIRTDNRTVCDYRLRHRILMNRSTVMENGHIKVVQFTNLRNGSYCFIIIPCRPLNGCVKNWSLHTDVLTILESKQRPAGSKASSSVSEILSIILLILVFISGMMMYCHHKLKKRVKKSLLPEEISEDEEISLIPYPEEVEIHILHSTNEETSEKITLLKDFLVNCAKFSNIITLEEELYLIYVDNRRWLRNILKKNNKIIFVQDKKVSKFMQYDISKLKENTSLESLSSNQREDQWLEYGEESIRIDWKRCFHDYEHLFVVFLDDDSSYNRPPDDITPRSCYSSPNDLIELCIKLNSKYDKYETEELKSLKKQLKQDLENHPVKDIFL